MHSTPKKSFYAHMLNRRAAATTPPFFILQISCYSDTKPASTTKIGQCHCTTRWGSRCYATRNRTHSSLWSRWIHTLHQLCTATWASSANIPTGIDAYFMSQWATSLESVCWCHFWNEMPIQSLKIATLPLSQWHHQQHNFFQSVLNMESQDFFFVLTFSLIW